MKTVIIDNYDSFTFNLFQMIAEVNGEEPLVFTNDGIDWEDLRRLNAQNIVISPGPGRPENDRDFGICRRALLETEIPLLGVCLGHEGIGCTFGGAVTHAPEAMHGRLSPVYHDDSELFKDIPQGFTVVRYHSLMVDRLPDLLERTAWTSDGVMMALRHTTRPLWGVQFHPESICTEYGYQLLRNFRDITHRFGNGNGHGKTFSFGLSSPLPTARAPRTSGSDFQVHSRKIDRLYDPERAFAGLMADASNAFWLDSSRVEGGLSRFSFIGDDRGPLSLAVTYRTNTKELTITRGDETLRRTESIFEYLEEELKRRRCISDELPFDFNCGYVGYFGYELKGECGSPNQHTARTPDAAFILADRIIAFDHLEKKTYLVSLVPPGRTDLAEEWFDEIESQLHDLPPLPAIPHGEGSEPISFYLDRDRATYLDDIEGCLQEIQEGETYEACLTNQIRTETSLDPLALYRTLRRVNPAPYSALLRFGDMSILSSSPERFLMVDRSGWVESKPIKGTRPRGATPEEDEAIRRELESCTKDRAENLMIVDLIRNDLGRVCDVGTVHVPKLMHVESYATVHQLVSTVRGRLRSEKSLIDCVRAAFPGGSMTGAPKLRTMEILDRLETEARGVYSGAIGFLALNGAADLNIVIRTIVVTPAGMSIGVGGAIVALSDPDDEFEEILLKGRALLQAIVRVARGDADPNMYTLVGTLCSSEEQ